MSTNAASRRRVLFALLATGAIGLAPVAAQDGGPPPPPPQPMPSLNVNSESGKYQSGGGQVVYFVRGFGDYSSGQPADGYTYLIKITRTKRGGQAINPVTVYEETGGNSGLPRGVISRTFDTNKVTVDAPAQGGDEYTVRDRHVHGWGQPILRRTENVGNDPEPVSFAHEAEPLGDNFAPSGSADSNE